MAESQERGGARSGGSGRGTASDVQADLQILQYLNGARREPGDELAGPPVAGAPFSGEATTTVTQTLGDGTRIEQRTTTKLFRDASGRVRREQTVIGLDRLKADPPETTITFDTVPGDPMPYVLDVTNRTARRGARGVQWFAAGDRLAVQTITFRNNGTAGRAVRLNGQDPIPNDVKPMEEQLGTRSFEGVKATGRRTTIIIPTDRIGNDKPIQITDEQWESPELRLTVYSRFSDPRTGVVEYRLTNVNRNEPRADLFAVPSDYTVIENTPGLRTGGRGERGGGRGARGQ